MEQLLRDAKLLVQRLHHHDNAADSLIGDATNLEAKLLSMKEYRDEVIKLNEIARHRPRSTLILGSKLENQRIHDLENENRELHLSLTEHQSALELIMNKYREQVLNLLSHKGLNKTALEHMNKNSGDIGTLTEKITEMAAVMQRAAQADEETESLDAETVAKLRFENKALRELLHISGHPKNEIEKLRMKAQLEKKRQICDSLTSLVSDTPSFELDSSSADEMENKTGTVKRKGKIVSENGSTVSVKDNVATVNGTNSTASANGTSSTTELSMEESLKIFESMVEKCVSDSDSTNASGPIDREFINEVVEKPKEALDFHTENADILKDSGQADLDPYLDPNSGNIIDANNSRLQSETAETLDESGKLASSSDVQEKEIAEDQLLELYNSEGRLLDGADDVCSKKHSPYDGRISGMKIRKSSKQKKVIQANLKTFFEKENSEDSSICKEVPLEVDLAVSENETGLLADTAENFESSLGDNRHDGDKETSNGHNLRVLPGESDVKEGNDSLQESIQAEMDGLWQQNVISSLENFIAEADKASTSCDNNPDVMVDASSNNKPQGNDSPGNDARVNDDDSDDTVETVVTEEPKEVEQSDSVDSGRSSSSSGAADAKKATHRTVELDFSDSDSEDAEEMIEDQFADIIAEAGEDSSSASSSDYSDHEPDDFEPTEEELVGDLEEGGEFVVSQWIRPEDELDHLKESWAEQDQMEADNKQQSGEEDDADTSNENGATNNTLASEYSNYVNGDGQNASDVEHFSFLQANYQIDQFTGGSIKAKYAKRKSYQNANKASAVTLSSGISPSNAENTNDSDARKEASVTDDAAGIVAGENEVEVSQMISAVKSSDSSISSSEDAISSSSDSQVDKTASESSSGEIDPQAFKRRLSVDPQSEDPKSDCAEHLTELLSDLDAQLALSDEDDDSNEN